MELNRISAISWWSVLLVEEPEYPGKTIYLLKISHKHHIMYEVHLAMRGALEIQVMSWDNRQYMTSLAG